MVAVLMVVATALASMRRLVGEVTAACLAMVIVVMVVATTTATDSGR